MRSAFNLFKVVKAHPSRYISSETISSLQDFINGYLIGNPYPDDNPPFWNFCNYLLNETDFEYKNGNRNLIARILLEECNGDELLAYECFFKYLEKYKSFSLKNDKGIRNSNKRTL